MSTYYLKKDDVLQTVINQAKSGDSLYLFPKKYCEKIEIKTDNLTLIGTENKTVISFSDYAKKPHKINYESNTFSSYTVGVFAKNVTICNLAITNDTVDPTKQGQAVALTVYGDNFKMQNCKLIALQDTLFLGPLPDDLITRYDGFLSDYQRYYEGEINAYFYDTEIIGSVDFIFGSAKAVFSGCDIKYTSDNRSTGYILAPSHSLKQKYGFIFIDCNFYGDKNTKVYLARPWRDYGKCSFIDCKIENVTPALFDGWGNSLRYKTARFEMDKIPNGAVGWAKQISSTDLEYFLELKDKQ